MNKWDKSNRKYAKVYGITNKILTFNVIELPKCFSGKQNLKKLVRISLRYSVDIFNVTQCYGVFFIQKCKNHIG